VDGFWTGLWADATLLLGCVIAVGLAATLVLFTPDRGLQDILDEPVDLNGRAKGAAADSPHRHAA